MKSKKVWLIRHAESEANAGGRTSDPAVIPLSKRGYEQSEEIELKFSEEPDLIVTSRYIRTKHTAAPIRKRFSSAPHEEWDIHEFTYLSPDRCINTTEADRLPMVKEYWDRCDPFYCDGDGAESFNDFINRVRKTLENIKKRDESFITVFSHGQFIAGLLWIMKNDISDLTYKEMQGYKNFLYSVAPQNGEIIEIAV